MGDYFFVLLWGYALRAPLIYFSTSGAIGPYTWRIRNSMLVDPDPTLKLVTSAPREYIQPVGLKDFFLIAAKVWKDGGYPW